MTEEELALLKANTAALGSTINAHKLLAIKSRVAAGQVRKMARAFAKLEQQTKLSARHRRR